jgi:Domain of unknown function (DUF397)
MEAVSGGLAWRKSSYCTGADTSCVEVAVEGATVLVRDSKDPSGPVLRFTGEEWRVFLLGAASGDFS